MAKTVVLTGGGGAIGAHCISHFMHNTDWDVVVLDSFRHKGFKDRIDRVCRRHPDWLKRLKIIQHDLVCPLSPNMVKEIGKVEHIFHLAALSDVFWGQDNPVYVIKNNIESTLTMLEYARQVKPKTFIYFSTDEVYGPVPNPGVGHEEWSTHRPSNAYAASKAACEDICYSYWRSYGVPVVITNTMNNFGEMQAPSKFPAMVQQRLQRGETVIVHGNKKVIGSRFYIHSRNAADALLFIIKNLPAKKHKIGELDSPDKYHIVGEKCLNNLELAKLIAELMGKELKYKMVDFHSHNPAHDIHYGLKDSKLRRAGWKPPIPLDQSLKNTISWQKSNPEWLT